MSMQTINQAAEQLGMRPRSVRLLCKQGKIKGAQKLGRDWVLPKPGQVPQPPPAGEAQE